MIEALVEGRAKLAAAALSTALGAKPPVWEP